MCLKTHLRGKSHLFAYLCLCAFAWASLCLLRFCLVVCCVLCRWNLFVKKIKRFKTALMTSFTLLLNLSYYKHEFLNHIPFQLSQSFSIITIFFNHHNLFQLSQSFSIITIFFNFFFFITTCDTIFMKISQRTNSII